MTQVELSFTKIQHIGIPVTDLARSMTFYQRLGFDSVMDSNFYHQGLKGRCVMMKKGEILMELYQLPGTDLEVVRNRQDGHVDHIAFDVEDIDYAYETLNKNGFTPIEPTPVFLSFWQKGCRYFNILGPDGERLEFNQIV